MGIDPGVSRLGGEIAMATTPRMCHTDAWPRYYMQPKMDGYKGIPGACSDEMDIGSVDTCSDQEEHAPSPDMYFMGVRVSLKFTSSNL